MKVGYTNLIPENVTPRGVQSLIVKDPGGNEVGKIPAGRMAHPTGEPDLIIAVVSDCHIYQVLYDDRADIMDASWSGNRKLENALAFFKQRGCKFVVGCGDFSQTGFYYENEKSDESVVLTNVGTVAPKQKVYFEHTMQKYHDIVSASGIPVFEIFGNHENMYKPITLDLARAKELTGIPATAYTVSSAPDSDGISGDMVRPNRHMEVGDKLFIMCGQSTSNAVMSDSDFRWLGKTLEDNKDRLCLVAVHSYIEEDSGDPLDVRENSIFQSWSSKEAFMSLLASYPNAFLVHGHSHMMLDNQKYYDPTKPLDAEQRSYKNANYTTDNGFGSMHAVSLGQPRSLNFAEIKSKNEDGKSQFSIVEFFDGCMCWTGYSIVGTTATPIPIGTYRIYV